MAMNKEEKRALGERVGSDLSKANGIIVAEYRGLTVEEVTKLRVELRKSDACFKVVKNRVAKKAIDQIEESSPGYSSISSDLVGPVGIVYSFGDTAQATKSALEFSKDHENFKVKAGVVERNKVSPDELKAIADLPSKEVMIGQIVGSLVSPHRGLVGVLGGVSRQLVQVINAIKDTKS